MLKKFLSCFFICSLSLAAALGQQKVWSSADIQIQLEKLNVLGSVLYFAAHPDDENTRLISWLAQEKKYRTGYLSLTRGEGGQNLIGTDLGVDLGLIRTQELLAARRIDKGEQFFSSAYDFGFSKTHQETFNFWDKERTLAEAVYIIRKFRPDVIITRFPPDKRGGHGHHQASAILAHEAYIAAADPTRFPDQLETVSPWKATRLIWNTANFGGMNNTSEEQLKIDIGAYNPLLGQSYGEIAAQSRSQHKSQGFGAASARGQQIEYFEHVAGVKAQSALMDGVNVSWSRITETEKIQSLIQKINQEFHPNHPERSVSDLFSVWKEIQKVPDAYWKIQKTKEVEDLIVACAGIWIEATSNQPKAAAGQKIMVNIEAIVRNPHTAVEIVYINSLPQRIALSENRLWKGHVNYVWDRSTQPYWLFQSHDMKNYDIDVEEYGHPTNKERPGLQIELRIAGNTLILDRDIQFRSVDPVRGEVHQELVVVPPLTVEAKEKSLLFTHAEQKQIEVTFTNHDPEQKNYQVKVSKPAWWSVSEELIDLDFSKSNIITKRLLVQPGQQASKKGQLFFLVKNELLTSLKTINYSHVPTLTWFPLTEVHLQHVDLVNPVKKVGYIQGAGDLVAPALANIGIEVSTLGDHQINAGYLAQFDAVVVGVRYFNVNEMSEAALAQLLRYAEQGGVVVVQYNVNTRLQAQRLGPYSFSLTRDRVTEEDAKVVFDQKDRVLNYPKKLTGAVFEGWVRGGGLSLAANTAPAYRTPLQMHDTDEPAHLGSLLIAPYGKGKFVYTSLSFFRQLPAGVPGAYRLFVNLLAKEK